ncbi:hypothetical protein DRO69_10220 [Candidatus Bathyarchaeota archaeon]|nr:MAG: hypothetical protein DRO69_10220 [Candidatus Bathyarchaeota archaeon]
MKNLKRIISILTILSLISGIFAFIESATATYPAPDETALFAYLDEITLTTSGTYTFDVKIQNKEDVTTIALDLHFDTHYVNITDIQANPEGELPGGSLLIGNWDPATGVIEMITYGILGDSWDITTPVSVIRVTVEVLNFTPPSGTVIDIYNMDCYDTILDNFLSGDCPYDHTLYYTYETLVHVVVADGQTFHVVTRSNSSVTDFNFSKAQLSITFNVTGTQGTTGWVNVTIPKALLDAPEPDQWTILIDGNPTTYTKTENTTHTFLYINYTHTTHTITITGTQVIPEFTPLLMLFVALATIILVIIRRKVYILGNKRISAKR